MASAPNILVIMTDQQKATAIDLYGGQVRTPNLARLVADGILYEHAFTPHPLCVPARVSFWTGRWPHTHGARTNETPMPAGEVHLARLLRDAGYRLALNGKNHCFTRRDLEETFHSVWLAGHGDQIGPGPASGITLVRSEVAAAPDAANPPAWTRTQPGYLRPVATVRDAPEEASATYQITEAACRFLEEHAAAAGNDPFCLWLSIPDPHEPYQVPARFAAMYPPESIALPPWRPGEHEDKPERQRVYRWLLEWDTLTEDDARLAMSIYFGMIAFIDERVGVVLDTLERLGLRDDTIVVFCSDHGDFMGEHQALIKCNAFYDCLTRVPLMVSYPRLLGAGGGQRRSELVSLVDVMPTLLRLAGLPIPTPVQGSMLPGFPPLPGEAAGTGGGGTHVPRAAVCAEYGAGGPPVTLADAQRLFPLGARRPLHPLLREREAHGHGKMVRTARWKYTHDVTGEVDELYDLQDDPWELVNRAADPAYAATVSEMRRLLADWLLETENARPVPLAFRAFWDGPPPPDVAPDTGAGREGSWLAR